MDLIERLQKKPEHERKQIALALTMLLFGLVIFLWVMLMQVAGKESEDTAQNAPSPFEALGGVLRASMSGTGAPFEKKTEAPENYAPVVVQEEALIEGSSATTTEELVPEVSAEEDVLPPPAP